MQLVSVYSLAQHLSCSPAQSQLSHMSFLYSYNDIRIEDDSWYPDTNLHSLAKECFEVELNKVYLKVGHDSPLQNHTDLPQSVVELVLLKVFGQTSVRKLAFHVPRQPTNTVSGLPQGFCHSLGCGPDIHARAAFRWFHSSSSSNLYTTDLQQQRRPYKTRLISPRRNVRIATWLQTCLDDLFLPVAGQFNPDHGFIIPTRMETDSEEGLTDPSQTLGRPPSQDGDIFPALPVFGVNFPLEGPVPCQESFESYPQVSSGNFEIQAAQWTLTKADFPVWDATLDKQCSYISHHTTSSASWADHSHPFAHIQRKLISPIFSRTFTKTPPVILPASPKEHQLLLLKPRKMMQQITIKHWMLPETFIGR